MSTFVELVSEKEYEPVTVGVKRNITSPAPEFDSVHGLSSFTAPSMVAVTGVPSVSAVAVAHVSFGGAVTCVTCNENVDEMTALSST
ncbi:MAG: hypothetical protein JNM69_17155 [Archangium sp.]|nr:hypothetical protein [Archangium sp.]